MGKDYTILDHVDHIRVDGDVFSTPANEYFVLLYLREGLDFLHKQVITCEQVVRNRLNAIGDVKVYNYGNSPWLEGIPRGLITCAFMWYAVSACQYVRTVGAIARRVDSSARLPHEYASKVIPEVIAFRDKVAAHFAWSTRNSKDNEAERAISVMPQLTWINDRFAVGALALTKSSSGKKSDSNSIKPWTIRGVHSRLCKRYWPESAREQTTMTTKEV